MSLPDNFDFNFTPDMAQAVAVQSMRFRLGGAFGFLDSRRVECNLTPEQMIEQGWWFDTVSLHWLPHWWPEWSNG